MKMINTQTGTEINVVEHIMMVNGWEYYVTDEKTDDKDIKFCLVGGFETELGDVYMPEIMPYKAFSTVGDELKELLPADGWKWK